MNKRNHRKATTRTIDTTVYLSVLRELVEDGESVSLLISGMSMFPFLEHERDSVFFEAPHRNLKKGDIVFYQRKTGQFVMHRICEVKSDGYYMVGDAQYDIEGPVKRDQIFAIVPQVQRDGKLLDSSSITWKFFEKVWINVIPFRKYLILPWRAMRKLKKLFMH